MPWSLDDGNQVFHDGNMLTEACWPNPGEHAYFHPVRAVASGGSENTLVCKDIPGSGGFMERRATLVRRRRGLDLLDIAGHSIR